MNDIPPFYVGQKVVPKFSSEWADVNTVLIVRDVFKHCCQWHIDVGWTSPCDHTMHCERCGTPLVLTAGGPIYPEAICFVPVDENFKPISLSKILEEETKLISVN